MKKQSFLTLVVVITTFLPVAEVIAESLPAPALNPPRVCEILGSSNKKLTIVAGPDLSNAAGTALALEFPVDVDCPFGIGTCSRWDYRYIWENMNPSLAFVDESSDLPILSIEDGGNYFAAGNGDPSGLGEDLFDVRVIRWTANESTFNSSFTTPKAEPRVATGAGKSGGFFGSCLIQGAGVPPSEVDPSGVNVTEQVFTPNAATENICAVRTTRDEAGNCVKIELADDPSDTGCTTSTQVLGDFSIEVDGIVRPVEWLGDDCNASVGTTHQCVYYKFGGSLLGFGPHC